MDRFVCILYSLGVQKPIHGLSEKKHAVRSDLKLTIKNWGRLLWVMAFALQVRGIGIVTRKLEHCRYETKLPSQTCCSLGKHGWPTMVFHSRMDTESGVSPPMKLQNVICVCAGWYHINMIFIQKSTQTFESRKINYNLLWVCVCNELCIILQRWHNMTQVLPQTAPTEKKPTPATSEVEALYPLKPCVSTVHFPHERERHGYSSTKKVLQLEKKCGELHVCVCVRVICC